MVIVVVSQRETGKGGHRKERLLCEEWLNKQSLFGLEQVITKICKMGKEESAVHYLLQH